MSRESVLVRLSSGCEVVAAWTLVHSTTRLAHVRDGQVVARCDAWSYEPASGIAPQRLNPVLEQVGFFPGERTKRRSVLRRLRWRWRRWSRVSALPWMPKQCGGRCRRWWCPRRRADQGSSPRGNRLGGDLEPEGVVVGQASGDDEVAVGAAEVGVERARDVASDALLVPARGADHGHRGPDGRKASATALLHGGHLGTVLAVVDPVERTALVGAGEGKLITAVVGDRRVFRELGGAADGLPVVVRLGLLLPPVQATPAGLAGTDPGSRGGGCQALSL